MLTIMKDGTFHLGYGWRVVSFWPYTTCVLGRILETDWQMGNGAEELRQELLKRAKEDGHEDAHNDNKIAFGVQYDGQGPVLYIGFYDGRLSVGTSFRTDPWNLERRYRQVLSTAWVGVPWGTEIDLNRAEGALHTAHIPDPDLNLAERVLADLKREGKL